MRLSMLLCQYHSHVTVTTHVSMALSTCFCFELYAFIILTSTLVLGINYFVIITRVLVDQHSHNRPQHFPCR